MKIFMVRKCFNNFMIKILILLYIIYFAIVCVPREEIVSGSRTRNSENPKKLVRRSSVLVARPYACFVANNIVRVLVPVHVLGARIFVWLNLHVSNVKFTYIYEPNVLSKYIFYIYIYILYLYISET